MFNFIKLVKKFDNRISLAFSVLALVGASERVYKVSKRILDEHRKPKTKRGRKKGTKNTTIPVAPVTNEPTL